MLSNYQAPSIFLGLFLRKLEVQDFREFSEALPWRLPELDAEPALNRIPDGQQVPADTPRVRFASKDGRLLVELAPAKLHFRMMPGEVTRTDKGTNVQALPMEKAFESFVPAAMRVHTTLSEHFGLSATRVGVVADFIAPVTSSANQRMQKHLLNDRNLLGDRLQDLQINALSRIQINGTNANRRINARPMRTGQEGNPDLIFAVNVDINSLADEPYDLSTQDLEGFLNGVKAHLDTQVPLLNDQSFFE
jgi:hypothetical protein